ncbi:NnrU family protein [Sphaerotilus sp.]|uniref:NnrU family protein n=1 Tax=Sphaerotilus sp. TaxID=2093942 RepID=UPI002ACDAF3A|nr:NnrU family protein [Sphaerotilus sp.]MDZ7856450.1 NnrU family protein [Sphaerotilus sp.]
MTILLLGLLLFLGVHSVRIFADDWRTTQVRVHGPLKWKAFYTLVSAVGLALVAWGYGLARAEPVDLWMPPAAMRHVAALLMLLSFVLLTATYVPGSRLKAKVRHPMVLGVKVWALAHLLSNGRLADVVLFGSFLVWAVLSFRAARQRDRAAGSPALPLHSGRDVITAFVGIFAWIIFALWLHGPLIGVRPFG